jgi:hypothetical protein
MNVNNKKNIGAQLDEIFDKLFTLLGQKKYNEVTDILKNVDVDNLELSVAIGYMVPTAHYNHVLPYRKIYLQKLEERLKRENRNLKMLDGLRGKDIEHPCPTCNINMVDEDMMWLTFPPIKKVKCEKCGFEKIVDK